MSVYVKDKHRLIKRASLFLVLRRHRLPPTFCSLIVLAAALSILKPKRVCLFATNSHPRYLSSSTLSHFPHPSPMLAITSLTNVLFILTVLLSTYLQYLSFPGSLYASLPLVLSPSLPRGIGSPFFSPIPPSSLRVSHRFSPLVLYTSSLVWWVSTFASSMLDPLPLRLKFCLSTVRGSARLRDCTATRCKRLRRNRLRMPRTSVAVQWRTTNVPSRLACTRRSTIMATASSISTGCLMTLVTTRGAAALIFPSHDMPWPWRVASGARQRGVARRPN